MIWKETVSLAKRCNCDRVLVMSGQISKYMRHDCNCKNVIFAVLMTFEPTKLFTAKTLTVLLQPAKII